MIVSTKQGWIFKHWWPLKPITSYMYGTKHCFNIKCFIFTNNIPSISSYNSYNNSYNNHNNGAVQQVGEESIRSPLTEAQVLLLSHGPNFAITPRSLPYGEYITVVEQACLNLEPHNAEELRVEIRGALRHAHNPQRNITKEEAQTIAELQNDHSRVILTADKGVALVVMDRANYNNKAQKLLEDRGTYKEIKTDPTNKQNKLVNLLKKTKAEGGISGQLYKKMYYTRAVAPKLYRLLKIHKRDIPLRPIVSSGVLLVIKWLKSYQES